MAIESGLRGEPLLKTVGVGVEVTVGVGVVVAVTVGVIVADEVADLVGVIESWGTSKEVGVGVGVILVLPPLIVLVISPSWVRS